MPSTGDVVISGNVIRDSNSDGIMIIDDLGVQATATVTDNVIKDLSQGLPDPLDRSASPTTSSDRAASR